jgi:ketosteroid isomerase-like protein
MTHLEEKIAVLLFSVVFFFMGCNQQSSKKETITDSKLERVRSENVSDLIIDWVEAINNANFHDIEKTYASNAIKVISADSLIEDAAQIAKFYGTEKNKITAIESLFKVVVSKERQINYELVSYTTEDLKEYVQIIIWSVENGQVKRAFEFTERSSPEAQSTDTNEIADRRRLWIELCNANNAENLIKKLYTTDAIYFNHKPIVKGTEALIVEYDYMNNKDYTLNLQPLKVKMVNANIAFEIGQCSGSYKGKYILVWKKQLDGSWKIYIDSNS